MGACVGVCDFIRRNMGLLEELGVILEGLRVLLEDWADVADFDWLLHEKIGEKKCSGDFY